MRIKIYLKKKFNISECRKRLKEDGFLVLYSEDRSIIIQVDRIVDFDYDWIQLYMVISSPIKINYPVGLKTRLVKKGLVQAIPKQTKNKLFSDF